MSFLGLGMSQREVEEWQKRQVAKKKPKVTPMKKKKKKSNNRRTMARGLRRLVGL